jgi:hypothetical protein
MVPYQKGYFFLRTLEDAVGRPAFDAWLKAYLAAFAFGAITTDDFVAHFEAALPGVLAKVGASRWIDGAGIPDNAPVPRSARLDAIAALVGGSDPIPTDEVAASWSATEWQLYLESLSRPASEQLCRSLDERFALTRGTNYEVLVAWLQLALASGYRAVLPRVEEVLAAVGRMKYLRPLYIGLARDPATRPRAHELFAKLRPSYHPIAQQVIEGVLRDG